MTIKGIFWHVHHEDELLEYCYDYDERVRFIKENKPKNEQELRLRLFQPVKGKLPVVVVRTWAAYQKAWVAYNRAVAAYDKAGAAYEKVRATRDKAIKDNMPAIEKLHQEECPDCPWDGKTIFRKD